VVDGDTIRLDDGTRVRLVQIDAPEVSGGECYGKRARTTLASLLPEGRIRIRLRFDPNLDTTDRYGRRLAYVFKGKELVNLTLVRRGAASAFFYRGDRGRYAQQLDAAAREARAAGRGLWGACAATEYDPSRAIAAKLPPPPPKPVALAAPAPAASNCHPSYTGACLDPSASDYDCAGGSGNGPAYTGYVNVVGYDEYELDRDGDGAACEG
jgi:endonuclease YncB( thermonuclease family)